MKLTNAGTALGELPTRHLASVLYGAAPRGIEAVQERVFKLIAAWPRTLVFRRGPALHSDAQQNPSVQPYSHLMIFVLAAGIWWLIIYCLTEENARKIQLEALSSFLGFM